MIQYKQNSEFHDIAICAKCRKETVSISTKLTGAFKTMSSKTRRTRKTKDGTFSQLENGEGGAASKTKTQSEQDKGCCATLGSSDTFFTVISVFQALVACAMLASAGVFFSGGVRSKDDDDGTKTDKGGFRFDFTIGNRVVESVITYMFHFLFSVLIVAGVVMLFEFVLTASGMQCKGFEKFKPFRNQVVSWKIRAFMQHLVASLLWPFIWWCLIQSAGETDGKTLVGSLGIMVLVFMLTYFARILSAILSKLYVTTATETGDGETMNDEVDIPSDTSALASVSIHIGCFVTLVLSCYPEFIRWMAFMNTQKITGFTGGRTNALWAAHIMFSVGYYAYLFVNWGEALRPTWDAIQSWWVRIPLFFFPLGPMNGFVFLLGLGGKYVRWANGKNGEALFVGILNSVMFLAIGWILYLEAVTGIPTVSTLPTT